jgi:hypothetical protein
MPVYPYQNREVRDLAWACFSPPLLLSQSLQDGIGNARFPLTTQRRAWLERLDRDPRPLQEHLSQLRSQRLGLYFESLWQFFLSSDPEVKLIAHNLPVYGDDRTLGEFDCIYYCRRRHRPIHLELAVKFYLGAPHIDPSEETSDWRNWLGPNTRDRLDLKLSRLLEHQIRLSELPEAKAQLQRLGIDQPIREIEVKGYLFQPSGTVYPPPMAFNPEQKINTWLSIARLSSTLEKASNPGFMVLPRSHWLSPAKADGLQAAWKADRLVDELSAHFRDTERPLLVAGLDAQGNENERFFVTGAHWPNLA